MRPDPSPAHPRPHRRCALAATALLCAAAAGPAAATSTALVTPEVVEALRGTLDHDIVALALANQNAARAQVTAEAIATLDATWAAERASERQPLMTAALTNPLSNYLTRLQAHSEGLYVEIIVFDAAGLNAGQSVVTSDYWQGDEAKYERTVAVAPDAVFVDEAEWHEESGTWRAQVNLAIPAPEGGRAAGGATFELNLTELARRAAR